MLKLYVKAQNLLQSVQKDESGQDMIEYGLMLSIIAVGVITILPAIASKVLAHFTAFNTALT